VSSNLQQPTRNLSNDEYERYRILLSSSHAIHRMYSPFQFCSSVSYPDKPLVDPCLSAVDLASNSAVATGRKASECSVPEVLLHYVRSRARLSRRFKRWVRRGSCAFPVNQESVVSFVMASCVKQAGRTMRPRKEKREIAKLLGSA
jgi:hypothetical protein